MKRTRKDIKSSKLKPHAAEKPSAPLPAVSDEHVAYLRRLKRHNRFIIAMQRAILVAFIGLWQLFGDLGIVNTFIVSAPLRVLKTLARLNASGELFVHIGVTMLETIAGFTVGTLVGTLIAVLMWWSKTLSRILDPYMVVLNALPKIALGPIIIVWVGAGMEAIIVMALLISTIVTIMTVLAGFNEISAEKQLLMRTLGANKMQTFLKVILPASVPTIIGALKHYEHRQNQFRFELGRRHRRRIPRVQIRSRLSYRLRRSGVSIGSCYDVNSDPLHTCRFDVLLHRLP